MTMLSKHNSIQRDQKETRAYQERLQEEINQDREDYGKKPIARGKFDNDGLEEVYYSL
jgi:hypothetical protein